MAENASGTQQDPTPPRVQCKECLKEIPPSEAGQPEAEEYALHFCGLECYRKWHERAEKELVPGKGEKHNRE